MLYKSSVLTATFSLLSILAPSSYANGQSLAVPTVGNHPELHTVKLSISSDALAQSDPATESAISREQIDPSSTKTRSIEPPDLVVSELSSPAANTPRIGIEQHSMDVVVNPDLPVANLAMGYVSPLSEALPSSNRSIAQAPGAISLEEPKKWAVGIHAQASTTGLIGVDGGYKFSPNLHARLGLNTVGFNYNYSSEGIDYK
jgi:hypothetical protein